MSCIAAAADRLLRRLPTAAIGTMLAFALGIALGVLAMLPAHASDLCLQYRGTVIREAQAVRGPDAPAPLFLGQLRQESSCRAGVTAWDTGRGLAQFMDGTSAQIARQFPELGPPAPYDPRWAIRALVRYDGWIYGRVKGSDACQRWAAALKGYNAGPGYVLRAQRRSPAPGTWFGVTERINAGQGAKNFEYSRMYPRWIIFKHQPRYVGLGQEVCHGVKS